MTCYPAQAELGRGTRLLAFSDLPVLPTLVDKIGVGESGFVVSHPSDKNKDVARVGHSILFSASGMR